MASDENEYPLSESYLRLKEMHLGGFTNIDAYIFDLMDYQNWTYFDVYDYQECFIKHLKGLHITHYLYWRSFITRDFDQFFNSTLLHYAAVFNLMKLAKFLLDIGFCPNQDNRNRSTPFHEACKRNYWDMVHLMFGYRPDLNRIDKNGDYPLDSVTCPKLEKALIARGAKTKQMHLTEFDMDLIHQGIKSLDLED